MSIIDNAEARIARQDVIEAELRLSRFAAEDGIAAMTPTEALRNILSASRNHAEKCPKGAGNCLACSLRLYARQGMQTMGETA